jgi:hypothetical protein
LFLASAASGFAQGSAFTYQGRLSTGGTAANGQYEMTLEKVAALPLATWNYKSQDKSIRHIGPWH